MAFQQTLLRTIELAGVGLHGGQPSRVRIHPAGADTGINFACGGQVIPARAEFVVSTRRATALAKGEATVGTVEHLLAACYGVRIDNALVEVEGCELPALDGSAAGFTQELMQTGKNRQELPVRVLRLTRPVWVSQGERLLLALPASRLRLTFMGEFPGLGFLSRSFADSPSAFAEDIAPARTFARRGEIEQLLAQGLGRGGSLENVVILEEAGPPPGLRFADEPVRHKLLDLLGDLALLGKRLQAQVIAIGSGHELNLELVKKILKEKG